MRDRRRETGGRGFAGLGREAGERFFSEAARPLAEKLLAQIGHGTETLILPSALFNSIVPSVTPQGVAALVKMQARSTERVLERAKERADCGGVRDSGPGESGDDFAVGEGVWGSGGFLAEGTVSPYNSKVLRGSAGSIFRLRFVQTSTAELIPRLRERGVRLLATSSHNGTPLPEANWSLPLAIFIGNEGAGLGGEIMHQMDETLAIPQAAVVESLNAGVAASIVLYECARERRGSLQFGNLNHGICNLRFVIGNLNAAANAGLSITNFKLPITNVYESFCAYTEC